ncbi:hypothetical protein VT84_35100 [Gemmata sp. SH-PL17]|nr:hypothetical protein VT84_35100 [Gemmata sp. SH-PL17]
MGQFRELKLLQKTFREMQHDPLQQLFFSEEISKSPVLRCCLNRKVYKIKTRFLISSR